MNRLARTVLRVALFPLAIAASGGSELPSSSSIGSRDEDELGDHMSPAMRRAFERARAKAEAEAAQTSATRSDATSEHEGAPATESGESAT